MYDMLLHTHSKQSRVAVEQTSRIWCASQNGGRMHRGCCREKAGVSTGSTQNTFCSWLQSPAPCSSNMLSRHRNVLLVWVSKASSLPCDSCLARSLTNLVRSQLTRNCNVLAHPQASDWRPTSCHAHWDRTTGQLTAPLWWEVVSV